MSDALFELGDTLTARSTDEWYTPRWVFAAAGVTFDMDVAAPVDPAHRTVPAHRYLTVADDGLTHPWHGLIWCNPPYSGAGPWVDRWAHHPDGLLLVPALCEVRWIGDVLAAAAALTLLSVDFHRPHGGTARVRWPLILAGRGNAAAAVARIASADRYAAGAYLVRR
jgi:hypothetical protein